METPGQVAVTRQRRRIERERHQRRARRHDGDAELLGDAIAEGRRADLGHRQAAGCDDQRLAMHRPIDVDTANTPPSWVTPCTAQGIRHCTPARSHSVFSSCDNVERGLVAKELPERLFVPGYAVTLDQSDEIARRIARQRRTAKIGILRQVVRRTRVKIGEIAASAARDADLFAELVGMLDQQNAPPALSGDGGAHHPRGACADDDNVEARTGGASG